MVPVKNSQTSAPRAGDATATIDPERALALSYAPAGRRAALAALFELDDTLAQIVRTTRTPLVGQMRLTWWHAALCALDTVAPPAQPVLRALAAEVLPRGVSGTQLAGMIDGWEALLADPLDGAALARHAILRGAGLFEAAIPVLGAEHLGAEHDRRIERLGRGWAYADLGGRLRDETLATLARARALERLRPCRSRPIARAARALGALALSARMRLSSATPDGAPRRVARLAWHRLTGR